MSDDDPESKESNLLESPILGMEATFRALRDANQVAFRKAMEEAGGAAKWLISCAPRARSAIASLSEEILLGPETELLAFLLQDTESFWTGLNTRLRECAQCPEDGAACDDTRDRVPAGLQVRLRITDNVPREQYKDCARYKAFRARRRLQSYGLDARLSSVTLKTLAPVRKEIDDAFNVFMDTGEGKSAPRGSELLIEGKLAREYGAALFRNTLAHFGSASYQSVHAPTLVSEAKDAAATKKDSPITDLHKVDVLLIDGVDSALMKERWGLSKLQGLVTRRHDLMLCTIITSLCPAKEAFPGVSVLRV
jgi:hypothetical protein